MGRSALKGRHSSTPPEIPESAGGPADHLRAEPGPHRGGGPPDHRAGLGPGGAHRFRLPFSLCQLSGDVFRPDAPGALLCAGPAGRSACGRHVSGSGTGHLLSPHLWGNCSCWAAEAIAPARTPEGGRYDLLRRKAREWFPQSQETAHWSAQDCMPPDHVPYIGPYSSSHPGWYVATGFQKWGMTSSMAAATSLCDMIQGRDNPYAGLFLSQPSGPRGAARHPDGGRAGRQEYGQAILPDPSRGGQRYPGRTRRDRVPQREKGRGSTGTSRGALHPVDIRCPHLGCQLEWDPDEKTWDCPLPRLSVRLPGPAYLRARTDRPGLQSPDRPAVFTAISRAVSIMIDLVRKGLSLPLYQPGRSAGVRIFGGCPPDVSALHGLGPAARPPPPQLRRGRRGRWSGWSEKTFVSLDFPFALHAKLWYIIQAETHAGVVQWQNVSFPS